ncbi:MAG: long-chain fatty acid--CoA ligase, partial [Acidimicrobiia bacterium]
GSEELAAWHRRHDFADPTHPEAAAALDTYIQRIVDDVNRRFSRAERIRTWAIVPDGFPPETMTPTIKLRRAAAARRLATEIERLYSS